MLIGVVPLSQCQYEKVVPHELNAAKIVSLNRKDINRCIISMASSFRHGISPLNSKRQSWHHNDSNIENPRLIPTDCVATTSHIKSIITIIYLPQKAISISQDFHLKYSYQKLMLIIFLTNSPKLCRIMVST